MWSLQNVLLFLCTALCCVSSAAGSIDVIGYEDGDVQVPCRYDPGYEDYEKYLCRNDCGDSDVLITTYQGNRTTYSIYEDIKRRIVTVTISDLRSEDAGRYWCGVTRNGKDIYTEVKLEIKPDVCCDDVMEIQSQEEASVSISCPYESQDQNKLKYICKGKQPSTCLQQAVITSDSTQNTRFTLSHDKTSRFTVTISSLTLEDSGSYLCGVRRDTGLDVFSAVHLEVKGWCCVESKNMSGIVGRPVTLQCPYPPQHQNNSKFLCKGDKHNTCTDMMSQSRFTLHNVSSSSFWVTITELEAGDAGTYWCGSDSQWGAHNYTNIHLAAGRVHVESKNMSGIVGRPVTLQCPYPPQHQNNSKFLCKGDKHNTCTDMMSQSRFTLHNVSSSSFWVTITELEAGDAGTYWCGSDSQWGAHNYTNIHLAAGRVHVESKNMSGIVGRPVTLQCPYPPQHQNNSKFLCKGDKHNTCTDMMSQSRFTLHNVSSSSFWVTITELEAGDAGTYWCGSDSQWGAHNYTNIHLAAGRVHVESKNMSGIVGRPVTLQCPYPPQHQNNSKFLCKGDKHNTCTDMMSQSRFTLHNVSSSSFWVTITELEAGDAGTYWCGSDSQWGAHNYTNIHLAAGWVHVESKNMSGIVGRPVTLQCPYPPQHQNNSKFLCKGDKHNTCTDMMSQSRFTLHNVSSSSFWVTITELEAGDAGTYWCGSDSQWGAHNYTNIHLAAGRVHVESKNMSGIVGRPVTLQCPYPPQHQNNSKFLCKGDKHNTCTDMMSQSRFTLHNVSSSSFWVTITELEAGDAGTYWCGSDSQWGAHNYTNIHLAAVNQQETSTVETFSISSSLVPGKPAEEAARYVVLAVPAVLVLMLTSVLVLVYKHKCYKKRGNRNKPKTVESAMDPEDLYENHDAVVMHSKMSCYPPPDDEEPPCYGNISSQQIYNNEF